jgi:hypothetical protein
MSLRSVIFCIILATPYFGQCHKFGIETTSSKRFDEIASYIGDLISDYNAKVIDISKINDVAIVQIERNGNNDLTEKILKKIPKENAVLMPVAGEKVISQRIRTVAFVIILANNFEAVSHKFKTIELKSP